MAVDVGVGDVAAQEVAKGRLGEMEACLVVPERVVAVESYSPDWQR
jgi:hypothetical protein